MILPFLYLNFLVSEVWISIDDLVTAQVFFFCLFLTSQSLLNHYCLRADKYATQYVRLMHVLDEFET